MAKIAGRKKEESLTIAPEKRWTPVDRKTGRRIYLPSERGLDRSSAEALAESLPHAEVVPEAALDRFGKLEPSLLESAIEAAEAPDEE